MKYRNADILEETDTTVIVRLPGDPGAEAKAGGMSYRVHFFGKDQLQIANTCVTTWGQYNRIFWSEEKSMSGFIEGEDRLFRCYCIVRPHIPLARL